VAISRKLLNQDEYVVVSARTHVTALILPALLMIVIAAVAGFLTSLPTGASRVFLTWVIWLVALGVIGWLVVRPFLTWLATTYTVTDRAADHPHRHPHPARARHPPDPDQRRVLRARTPRPAARPRDAGDLRRE